MKYNFITIGRRRGKEEEKSTIEYIGRMYRVKDV